MEENYSMSNFLIKNGLIVDGTGAEPYLGHIVVNGDKIKKVVSAESPDAERLLKSGAKKTFDSDGFAVAPGFIDSHSHFDWLLPDPDHPDFTYPMIEQGITTMITGNCGYSPVPTNELSRKTLGIYGEFMLDDLYKFEWYGLSEFTDHLNATKNLLFNNVQLTGHGALHLMTTGDEIKRPSQDDMSEMVAIAKKTFDEGSFGLSLGLQYPPGIFSTRDELATLARATAEAGRVLTVHIKALSKISGVYPMIPGGKAHNLKALDEILKIGLEGGGKLQISHFIFVGKKSWPTAKRAVKMVEKARNKGLDVMWDIYPHFGGNSYITVLLPPWFIEDFDKNSKSPKAIRRLRFELSMMKRLLGFKFSDIQVMDAAFEGGEKYNGMNIIEISEAEGMDPVDVFLMLVRESDGKALSIVYGFTGDDDNEEVIERLMAHDLTLFETDTIFKSKGVPNPASYGAFPRFLGRFVRDKKIMTLADAIYKMTGKTADRFGIKERGTIKAGNFADLVLFDPERIADTTTRKNSASKPLGIEKVFSNGVLVVDNGYYIKGVTPGRAVSFS